MWLRNRAALVVRPEGRFSQTPYGVTTSGPVARTLPSLGCHLYALHSASRVAGTLLMAIS
jgi:hypothetical protein